MKRLGIILAGAFLFTAGCVGSTMEPATQDDVTAGKRIPVIALLDTGTNPYHEVFAAPFSGFVPEGLGGAIPISIDIEGRDFERDRATWEGLAPNVLYRFAGTRLFAISVDETPEGFPTLDLGHGAGTSYLAARDAPEAIVVMVQVDLGVCEDAIGCVADPSIADGMEWIAAQPWIDIVSVSIGFPGNPPALIDETMERYARASLDAAESHKIIVNGAGNTVIPPTTGYTNGPPWIVAVGGAEPESRGESTIAAKTSDIVANFSEQVPVAWDGTLAWSAGTSLATPIVAATLANALAEVWRAEPARVVATKEARDALNASAVVWRATDWRPTIHDRGTPTAPLLATDLPVLAPGQTGWGYVDASLAPEIARRILEGDLSPPADKQEIAAFQTRWQAAREAYWGAAR